MQSSAQMTNPHVWGLTAVLRLAWAARYNTWLPIELMLKGVVFSVLYFQFSGSACPLHQTLTARRVFSDPAKAGPRFLPPKSA